MRLLYDAHIPFVAVFLLFAVALACFNWKGRRPQ